VEDSVVLRELVEEVQLARGRLYLWREPREVLMARITPLDSRSMLLETRRGRSWVEQLRGPLAAVMHAAEQDTGGVFHGLGSLATTRPGKKPPAQVVLHRDLGIPIRVLAEPGPWYARRRRPQIVEVNRARDRALVRFTATRRSDSSRGTCLYARRGGQWGCYPLEPGASGSIADAEAWLDRRGWGRTA
jgi:hypothetical protein